jgi:hypothetical protein
VVHIPLHPIPPLGAFEKWGIDLEGASSYHPMNQQIIGGGNRLL